MFFAVKFLKLPEVSEFTLNIDEDIGRYGCILSYDMGHIIWLISQRWTLKSLTFILFNLS